MTQRTRRTLGVALISCVALLATTGCEKKKETTVNIDAKPGPVTGDCEVGPPSQQAELPAGPIEGSDDHILLNGRRISPYGTRVDVGTFPIGLASDTNSGIVAVSNNGHSDYSLPERATQYPPGSDASEGDKWQTLDLIDPVTGGTVASLATRSLFIGVAFSPDGTRLVASGGGRDRLRHWSMDSLTNPTRQSEIEVFGYPGGLAFAPDNRHVYVALMHRHRVAKVDLDTGKVVAEIETQAGPYEPAIHGNRLYVSNWSTDTVTVIDLDTNKPITHTVVGKNPEGIAISSDGKTAYVAVSDADIVAVIDTANPGTVAREINLRDNENNVVGLSPTDIQISDDDKRLYVVLAHENAIAVIDAATGERLGLIPTAFYPTGVELINDKVVTLSAKGYSSGPSIVKKNEDGSYVEGDKGVAAYSVMRGTVHIGDLPDDAALKDLTTKVIANNAAMADFYNPSCQQARNPVPLAFGDASSPIKHVVYIIRENKTYDSILGDLMGPDGDEWHEPQLTLWGEEITPNIHKLARQYTNFVNFYSESEQSVQGHIWTANGWVNDFSEKMWIAMWGRPGEAQFIAPGMEPASAPPGGDLFQHVLNHDRTVRVYGEYSGVVASMSEKLKESVDWKFASGFGIDDRVKIKEFIRELEQGIFPNFVYMVLGNDHTFGGDPGKPTPRYMIAENDEATGRVVEAISNSKFWPETAIIIIEDDPQSTPDHIDTHRSIGLVVSPWARRGHNSKVLYSNASLHKTTSLILGVPPMSRHMEIGAAMYDGFVANPDFTPYEAVPSNIEIEYNPDDGSEVAELSKKLDFSNYDRAPELGYVLWQMYKPKQMVPQGFHWPRSPLIGNLDSPVLPEDDDDDE